MTTQDIEADTPPIPPDVRAFLAELRPDEVKMLRDGIRLVAAVSTVGRAVRWGIILGAGLVVGLGAFGDAAVKIWHWLAPVGPKP